MQINSDKAEQYLRHLHLGIWRILFTAVWEQRNIFLHGKDSISMKYEREKLTTELRKWKWVAGSRLGYQQMYLVDYINDDITQWKTATKETIHLHAGQYTTEDDRLLRFDFNSNDDDVWCKTCTRCTTMYTRTTSLAGGDLPPGTTMIDRMPTRATLPCNILITNGKEVSEKLNH